MGDPTTSTSTSNFYGILGLPKSASIGDIGKAYKFLATRWNPEKNSSNRAEAEAKIKSIDEAYRVLSVKRREEGNGSNHDRSKSLEGGSSNHHHQNNNKSSENSNSIKNNNGQYDDFIISSPSLISSTSRRVTPTGTPRASLSKNSSRRSITPTSRDFFYSHSRSSSEISNPASPSTPTDPVALYKMASKRNSTPIIFSQSTVRKTPPPIEKKLECTLEELCHGCVKNVTIKRDVISNEGIFVEEEEGLQIRIKPEKDLTWLV